MKHSKKALILPVFFAIISLILIALVLSGTIKSFRIPTNGMAPTIQTDDYLFASRSFRSSDEFETEQIVIFRPPHQPESYYIQRIVALEGDIVQVIDGHLAVNGSLLESPDDLRSSPARKNPMFPSLPTYPLTIPKGQAFVMGDNYNNSLDSRYFGPIELDSISHLPHRIVLPLNRAGEINP